MELSQYVEGLRRELGTLTRFAPAEVGELADRLAEALDSSVRLTLLEVLYTRRRIEPESPSLSPLDLEKLTGRPREHLEFTVWYLIQKKYVVRTDSSQLTITVDGAEYLEKNYREDLQRRRLTAGTASDR